MQLRQFTDALKKNFLEKIKPFLNENKKLTLQIIFTLFFIAIGIWFFKHEGAEIVQVKQAISTAVPEWLVLGLILTLSLFTLHGFMYKAAFEAVNSSASLADCMLLFIKRNFISVFLPAGGISSLAFFSEPIQKKGVKESQVIFASSLYGFIGILSVVIVAIPAFVYSFSINTVGSSEWLTLGTVILLIYGFWMLYKSILNQGRAYKLMLKISPKAEVYIQEMLEHKIKQDKFLKSLFYSIIIEVVGIGHVYVAMEALHLSPSLFGSIMAYIISVIFLIVSPFLRGIGVIEFSMTYVLIRFGFGNVEAMSITLLYRFFEFWVPLFVGAGSFLVKASKLLLRIAPALLLFGLGILNIVSMLSPALAPRLKLIESFLPFEAIELSNYLVLFTGLFLLVTAAFMLKGLRSAWWFGLVLSVLSLFGHMTKGIDYEEALVAFVVIVILIFSRKEYYIRNNPRLKVLGFGTAALSMLAIIIYGVVGFYFLDKNHFDIDFSIGQSIRYSVENFFLVGSENLFPKDLFANRFLMSIKLGGLVTLGYLVYTLVKPFTEHVLQTEEELFKAKELIETNGSSPLDYFKTSSEKQFFFSASNAAFVSFRPVGNFAVVLECPVGQNLQEVEKCITEFDSYCIVSGLRSVYYRVPEASLSLFLKRGKKKLLIGQEAIVDVMSFKLEGGDRKSMRNGLKKVKEKGFQSKVYYPPLKDGLIQKLKSVSDEWLLDTERTEIVFSQGMFDWKEIKTQKVITVENEEDKIVAFLNVIPDFRENEGTYDLIRKTKDAPSGVMDFLLVALIDLLKQENCQYLNLGLAAMSGLEAPTNFPEKSMKFAYEKIKSFSHFKGLRDFKDKFSPVWQNEYLIYQHDYDLFNIPRVLANVIKP
ncbi:phosphatidylglycerol lysyltransferase domain-containing protein [Lacihabitans lacunae]|uniref:Phosphatidylglycerol lysyltransferase n=1 Tax=Lacihabitans lacunae TaxID=1028214 RepID=A0ABV7YYD2_9BACT